MWIFAQTNPPDEDELSEMLALIFLGIVNIQNNLKKETFFCVPSDFATISGNFVYYFSFRGTEQQSNYVTMSCNMFGCGAQIAYSAERLLHRTKKLPRFFVRSEPIESRVRMGTKLGWCEERCMDVLCKKYAHNAAVLGKLLGVGQTSHTCSKNIFLL